MSLARIRSAAAIVGMIGYTLAARAAPGNDALSGAAPAIGLTQAITVAEQLRTGSHATHAAYEHSRHHGWVYQVEIVQGAKIFDVTIDAAKGTVLSCEEDAPDEDGRS